MAADVTLAIGGRGYALPPDSARALAEWIRTWAGDGQGLDDDGRSLIYLAEAIDEDLDANGPAEPIDLGMPTVGALLAYVLRDTLVNGDDALTKLYVACRRANGDPPSSYFAKRGYT